MQIRSKEQWRQIFAEHAASGLSAQQFCRDKKLCAKYFSLRKKQLGWQESVSPFVRVQLNKPVARQAVVPPIVECRVASSLIVHHGNCIVRFACLPEAAFLAQLLRALS